MAKYKKPDLAALREQAWQKVLRSKGLGKTRNFLNDGKRAPAEITEPVKNAA